VSRVIHLPSALQRRIDAIAMLRPFEAGAANAEFLMPRGEPALVPADSVSWRIFKNPLALFVGGVAAVILELAEPRVRSGVWEYSAFQRDPVGRLQRTGHAAMVTVYAARSVSEPMIARVSRLHSRVAGETPAGEGYAASDPELLVWVQATAAFGFAEAYSRYVHRLSSAERDSCLREGSAAARLYGAHGAPTDSEQLRLLFATTERRLEASPIVFHFLEIMGEAPIAPRALRSLQRMLVRAAVELVPGSIRERLGLSKAYGLRAGEGWLVARAARLADRVILAEGPAAQSCVRLGLPADYLYS